MISPKVSIIILTKNRSELLKNALQSVANQSWKDFEIVVVNDGSTDNTESIITQFQNKLSLKTINHKESIGITKSRQEALLAANGELVSIIDDDDTWDWVDTDKLFKQVEWFNNHKNGVLVGAGMQVNTKLRPVKYIFRPEHDKDIRATMLFRNNFFTSTVMFKRSAAIDAGGFIFDGTDVAEDYDLWLRIGMVGEMGNLREIFTIYRFPSYNKDKFKQFLKKQLRLIKDHKTHYPHYWLASLALKVRLLF